MRIFVLGDSYSDNLFKQSLIPGMENEITKFVNSINNETSEKAMWWTDWLEQWGYEINNFAIGGSTLESLIYQFGKIDKEYRLGDRIILNLTHPSRFNWYNDEGECTFFHSWADHVKDPKMKILFEQQALNREKSFNSGYLKKELIQFIDYLIVLHSKHKPIVWSTFKDSLDAFKNGKYFFNITDITNIRKDHDVEQCFLNKIKYKSRIQINQESNDYSKDKHFGRYGNYELAILFNEILKTDVDGYYLNNNELKQTLTEVVMNNSKEFEIPASWSNNNYLNII